MSRSILVAAAVLSLGLACSRMPGRANAHESILVNILNENFYDARIHAVYGGGQRRSLGTVPGNGGRTAVMLGWEPRSLVFEVLFVTDGAAYVSQPVDVAAGDSIEVRVPANISGSGFFRRVRRN